MHRHLPAARREVAGPFAQMLRGLEDQTVGAIVIGLEQMCALRAKRAVGKELHARDVQPVIEPRTLRQLVLQVRIPAIEQQMQPQRKFTSFVQVGDHLHAVERHPRDVRSGATKLAQHLARLQEHLAILVDGRRRNRVQHRVHGVVHE